MREIKFRAWYKLDDPPLLFEMELVPNDDGYFINKKNNIIYSIESPFIDEDFILEQFTGLYDKNGKEIYEGDIVGEFFGVKNQVVDWSVSFDGDGFPSSGFCVEDYATYKIGEISGIVIGNIHENPELLEIGQ